MARPYVNEEMVKRVVYYRKKGLSFPEIARVLKKDQKTVYRWWSYSQGSNKYLAGGKGSNKDVDKVN